MANESEKREESSEAREMGYLAKRVQKDERKAKARAEQARMSKRGGE